MADLQDVIELKKKVDAMRRDADRAAGALDETMKRLKDEFGCDTIKAAKQKVWDLKRADAGAKDAFSLAFASIKKEFDDEGEEN